MFYIMIFSYFEEKNEECLKKLVLSADEYDFTLQNVIHFSLDLDIHLRKVNDDN